MRWGLEDERSKCWRRVVVVVVVAVAVAAEVVAVLEVEEGVVKRDWSCWSSSLSSNLTSILLGFLLNILSL